MICESLNYNLTQGAFIQRFLVLISFKPILQCSRHDAASARVNESHIVHVTWFNKAVAPLISKVNAGVEGGVKLGGDGGGGYSGMRTKTDALAVSNFSEYANSKSVMIEVVAADFSLPKSTTASNSSGSCITLTDAAHLFEISSPLLFEVVFDTAESK